MSSKAKRWTIGFGITVACWLAFVIFLPRLPHCAAPRLPLAVLSSLLSHARMVCAGDSLFGSSDSLLLSRIEELRDQENQYFVKRFSRAGKVEAVAAYPRKRQAYLYNLLERITKLDWELQSQHAYVLTAGGELYNSYSFDAQNPIIEGMLPENQPEA